MRTFEIALLAALASTGLPAASVSYTEKDSLTGESQVVTNVDLTGLATEEGVESRIAALSAGTYTKAEVDRAMDERAYRYRHTETNNAWIVEGADLVLEPTEGYPAQRWSCSIGTNMLVLAYSGRLMGKWNGWQYADTRDGSHFVIAYDEFEPDAYAKTSRLEFGTNGQVVVALRRISYVQSSDKEVVYSDDMAQLSNAVDVAMMEVRSAIGKKADAVKACGVDEVLREFNGGSAVLRRETDGPSSNSWASVDGAPVRVFLQDGAGWEDELRWTLVATNGTFYGTGAISAGGDKAVVFDVDGASRFFELLAVTNYTEAAYLSDIPSTNGFLRVETDPVWNAEKGDYATKADLSAGRIKVNSAEYADSAHDAYNAEYAVLAEGLRDGPTEIYADAIFARLDAATETNAQQTAALERKLDLAGGTMTGPLVVESIESNVHVGQTDSGAELTIGHLRHAPQLVKINCYGAIHIIDSETGNSRFIVQIPYKSGTLALTSDIPDVSAAIGTKFAGQTFDLSTEDAMFESLTNIIIQLGGAYIE